MTRKELLFAESNNPYQISMKTKLWDFLAFFGVSFAVALPVLFLGAFITSWFLNAYKLCQCDFKSPFKGEVIHAVGVLFPIAAPVTVWFDDK